MSSVCLKSFVQADVLKSTQARDNEPRERHTTRPKHMSMPGSHSEDSGFGDDLVLSSTQTARISSARVGAAASVKPESGQKKKIPGSNLNMAAQVRAACIVVVHK